MTKQPSQPPDDSIPQSGAPDSQTHIEHSQGPVLSGTFHSPVTLNFTPEPSPSPPAPPSDEDQAELAHLHHVLHTHFDREELRTLCFKLGVRYDDLGGEGHSARARELVQHQSRRPGGLERLRAVLEVERPGALAR